MNKEEKKYYRVLRPISWKGERMDVGRYINIPVVDAENIGVEFLIEEEPKNVALLGDQAEEVNMGSYEDDDETDESEEGIDLEKLTNKQLDSFAKENFDIDTTKLNHEEKISAIEEAVKTAEEVSGQESEEVK